MGDRDADIDDTAATGTGVAGTGVADSTGTPAADSGSRPPVRGYSHRRASHLQRLRRIEGQVRGLQRMVEDDQYCIDILTQVAAATRALQSFSLELLDEHLAHCVVAAAQRGGPEADAKVREASEAIARLVRS